MNCEPKVFEPLGEKIMNYEPKVFEPLGEKIVNYSSIPLRL